MRESGYLSRAGLDRGPCRGRGLKPGLDEAMDVSETTIGRSKSPGSLIVLPDLDVIVDCRDMFRTARNRPGPVDCFLRSRGTA